MEGEPKTKSDTGSVENRGENYFKPTWSLVLGALLSGIIGLVFFRYKRGRDAKDHLLVTISQLGGELERAKDVLDFYDSTLLRTEEAVFRLRPFLRKTRGDDLSVIWNLYRQARATLQKAGDDDLISQSFWDYFSKRGYQEPKTKRELVRLYHKKITEIAT